jgi:hypothetical protein
MKVLLVLIAVVGAVVVVRAHGAGSHRGQGGGFCASHACIGNFGNGNGYVVQCADGTWSRSGGEQGACSYHGGER